MKLPLILQLLYLIFFMKLFSLFSVHRAISCRVWVFVLPRVIAGLWLCLLPVVAQQNYTISGYIKEEESLEPIPGAVIYLPEKGTGVVSNSYGFYSITLPEGRHPLLVSFVGMQSHVDTLSLTSNISYDVTLISVSDVLDEVVVEAEAIRRESEETQASRIVLDPKVVADLPSVLGEKDVLKVLQLMPGIQSAGDALSGLYVRGGGPDQNLFILDDASVYNASHLFGFFSVFNGDAIKSVNFYKGGFPARYGGRISSVLDLGMREGNKKEWHGKIAASLMSAQVVVEGPIKKGKTAMLFSGRRTYFDPFLALGSVFTQMDLSRTNFFYNFHDFNLKFHHEFSSRDKIYLSGYYGQDYFSLRLRNRGTTASPWNDFKFRLNWANYTGTLRWNHQFSPKMFSNMSAIASNYTFGINVDFVNFTPSRNGGPLQRVLQEARFSSLITDYKLKYDVEYFPSLNHSLRFGSSNTYHVFDPNSYSATSTLNTGTGLDNETISNQIGAWDLALYAEDEMKYGPFQANIGLRAVGFAPRSSFYFELEPRVSVSWLFLPRFSLKAGYARMNQFLHLLVNSASTLPSDIWVPATDSVPGQQADHYTLGLVRDFGEDAVYTAVVEGYYRQLRRIVAYKPNARVLTPLAGRPGRNDNINWESQLTSGDGRSWGIEFLLRKNRGRWTGWVGYTLSYTSHRFPDVNEGVWFAPRYDRRHDVSITSVYEINPRIKVSGAWVFSTGNTLTLSTNNSLLPTLSVDTDGNPVLGQPGPRVLGLDRNNFRAEPYHRLDLNCELIKRGIGKNGRWTRRIQVGAYNAYSRLNPFSYNVEVEDDNPNGAATFRLARYSLFPIIPYITFSYEF